MKIFPAIDIINGKVVRLCKGEYDKVKNYALSPLEAATGFINQGAVNLHIVDLDGAKSGKADNARSIEEIANKHKVFIEVGGGIRSFDQIEKYIDCGVSRCILGTIAVKDFDFVERAVAKFGNIIAVGVDALNGFVAVSGWEEVTKINSLDFCKKLKKIGISNVIYTDISKDGMLKGTNLEIYEVLCQAEYPKITASGGISDIKELEILKNMGIYGAILGKSLYENKINLNSAIKVAEDIC